MNDFYSKLGALGFQVGSIDVLALLRGAYPQGYPIGSLPTDVTLYEFINANSFDFNVKQAVKTDSRYAGEGAEPNTFSIPNISLSGELKFLLQQPSMGYIDPAFALLWDYCRLAYYGTAQTIKCSLKEDALAGSESLVVTNIVDFISTYSGFNEVLIIDELGNFENITISDVSKADKTLSLVDPLSNNWLTGSEIIAVLPRAVNIEREPSFSVISLREGLITPCLVNKLVIDITAGKQVSVTAELFSLNINREKQIELVDILPNLQDEFVNQYRVSQILDGSMISLSESNSEMGDFGLETLIGDCLFTGYQSLDLPLNMVTGITITIDNNLDNIYAFHSLKSDITKKRRENSFPSALISKGRKITGTIKYNHPVDAYGFAEKLAGHISGLKVNFGDCYIDFPNIVWSPSTSSASMDENQNRTLNWSILGQHFNSMSPIQQNPTAPIPELQSSPVIFSQDDSLYNRLSVSYALVDVEGMIEKGTIITWYRIRSGNTTVITAYQDIAVQPLSDVWDINDTPEVKATKIFQPEDIVYVIVKPSDGITNELLIETYESNHLTLIDTAITITITNPASAMVYDVTTPTVSMAGTVVSSIGIDQVIWETSETNGICTGTTSWEAIDIPLLPDNNEITIRVTDLLGNTNFCSINIVYSVPPIFNANHTLPRLSWWTGASVPAVTAKELTENWGYSLQAVVTDTSWLGNPVRANSVAFDLSASDPEKYPLHILTQHYWSLTDAHQLPESVWCHLDGVNGTEATRVLSSSSGYLLANSITSTSALTSVIVNKPITSTVSYWDSRLWDSVTNPRPASGWIRVDSETMAYSSYTNDRFIISERGAFGTTPATHSIGATIAESPTIVYSLEAPTSIFENTGADWSSHISAALAYYDNLGTPVNAEIVLNGEEYGLTVSGFGTPYWLQDIDIRTARDAYNIANGHSNTSWYYYLSYNKARQDLPIADAFRAAVPNRDLYVAYTVCGSANPHIWAGWGFGYEAMNAVTDVPSEESYYAYYASWLGSYDIYRRVTNAITQQIPLGDTLSYDFLSAGWRGVKNTLAIAITSSSTILKGVSDWPVGMPTNGWVQIDREIIAYENLNVVTREATITERGVDGSTIPYTWGIGKTTKANHSINASIYKFPERSVSNPNTWMGFMKLKYALGSIGSCLFYSDPVKNDPHWVWQFRSIGHVHALYSHLEDYLRDGDLLDGDGNHAWATDAPSYDFNAYKVSDGQRDVNVHVAVRKRKTTDNWLIAVCALDAELGGIDREVTVDIPVLGTVTVNARIAGSVYLATLNDNTPVLTLVDTDALHPSANISI